MSELRLGDHCEKIGSGATPKGGKESYLPEGPYSLIRSQNVYNHGFEFTGLAFISEDQARKLNNAAVSDGDVLVNITGDSVARACRVHPDALPARVNQHVAIIRPRPGEIDPLFLRYWLVAPAVQAQLLGLASAGATRSALTKAMLENLRVPDIPVSQQCAIGEVLCSLDDKIELNRRMNGTLEAMAQAIFRDWFVDFGPTRRKLEGATDPVTIMGGLVTDPARAQELADLFPAAMGDDGLPEGWVERPVGELATIKGGKQLSREDFDPNGDYPVFGGAGIMGKTYKHNADGYVITVGRVGAYCGRFVAYRGKAWVNNNASLIVPKQDFPPEWFFLALSQLDLESIKKGAAQPFVSNGDIAKLSVVFPGHLVLSAFHPLVSPLILRAENSHRESEVLASTRDLLLPKLMSGEIRLGDAEEIVGAAQ